MVWTTQEREKAANEQTSREEEIATGKCVPSLSSPSPILSCS